MQTKECKETVESPTRCVTQPNLESESALKNDI